MTSIDKAAGKAEAYEQISLAYVRSEKNMCSEDLQGKEGIKYFSMVNHVIHNFQKVEIITLIKTSDETIPHFHLCH